MKEETKTTKSGFHSSEMDKAAADERKPPAASAVKSETSVSNNDGKSSASTSANASKSAKADNGPRKQESGSGGEDSGGSEGRGYWASGSSGGDDRNSGPESDESASDEKQGNSSSKEESDSSNSIAPAAAAGSSDDSGNSKKNVCSSYQDCSKLPPLTPQSLLPATSSVTKEPTFPVKLHMMLANPEFHEIITWLPHGRSWRILKQKDFENQVLPMYFRHANYASFTRQVNGWGFKRIAAGSDYNSYYHQMFLRGVPHLCERMRRLSSKDVAKRREETANEPPPDLYLFSQQYPLPEAQQLSLAGSIINTPPAFTGATSSSSQASLDNGKYKSSGSDAVSDIEALAEIEKRRQTLLATGGHQQVSTGPSSLSGSSAGGDDVPPANQAASSSSKNTQDRNQNNGGPQQQNDIDVLTEFMKTVDPQSMSPEIYMQLLSMALAEKKKKEQQLQLPRPQQAKNADLPQIVNLIFELSRALPQGLHSLLKLVELLVDQDKKEKSTLERPQTGQMTHGNRSSFTRSDMAAPLPMNPPQLSKTQGRRPEGLMQPPPPKRQHQNQQSMNAIPKQENPLQVSQGGPQQMNETVILQQILSAIGGNVGLNVGPSSRNIPQQNMMAPQQQHQAPPMHVPQHSAQASLNNTLPVNMQAPVDQPVPQQQQEQQAPNQPMSQQQLNNLLGAFMMQQSGSSSMNFN